MENKNIMEENNSDNCAYIQIQETEHDPESISNTDEFYIRGKFNLWKRDIFSNIMHQFGKESVGKRS
jgi:hypothetical protein